MGVQTFDEFKDDMKFEFGRSSSQTDLDTKVAKWINVAYLQFASINKIGRRWLTLPALDAIDSSKSTGDGVKYVTEPSGYLFVHTVYDVTNATKLKFRDHEWYWEQTDRDDSNARAKPQYWIPYGTYLYLHPTPNSAYVLEIPFRKRPTLMNSTTNTTTVIGDEWDEPILKLAVIIGLRKLRMYDRAKEEEAAWERTMQKLMGMKEKQRKDSKDYLRPSWTYIDQNRYRGHV